jgi:hypothetical protein
MDRRVVMVAAVAAVLVVLAAASGPVRVWTTPTLDSSPPPVETTGGVDTNAPTNTVADQGGRELRLSGVVLQILGILVVIAGVLVLVAMSRSVRPRRLRRHSQSRDGDIAALPEFPEDTLSIDVDAARAALATGEPRNAIVACWMQLERDAAAAGLPRLEAETSAEYAERVVALSSVDPIPIGELAALYREARFSRHELNDDHRSRAFAALTRVAAALRRGVKVAQ